MKNRLLVGCSVVASSLILLAGLTTVKPSYARPEVKGGTLQADGVPLPPPPTKPKPTVLVADGVPLPPPPTKPKPTSIVVADGVPLPPPPTKPKPTWVVGAGSFQLS